MKITALCLLLLFAAAGAAVAGGGPENVLVVVNDLCEDSIAIARYYMAKRNIPRHHIVHVKIPGQPPKDPKKPEPFYIADQIAGGYDGYLEMLENPVKEWLAANKTAPITTILLTRGIPVVTIQKGAGGQRSTAHLLACHACPAEAWTDDEKKKNPIYRTDQSIDPADPSKPGAKIYCVGMLNAFSVDDVKRMVDLAIEADDKPAKGTVYLGLSADKDPRGMYSPDFQRLSEWLQGLGFKSEIVPHAKNNILLESKKDVMFYQYGQAGWDSTFPAKNKFLPGCVVDNLTSFGLVPRQFDSTTTAGQTPMPHFLRAGATAVQGCVAEPTTGAWDPKHFHIEQYFSGYNLIESYTMGHPWMPWMNLVCGDPLLQPWAKRPTVKQEAWEKIEPAEAGKKPSWKLKVSAKATRAEAKIAKIRLFVDGVFSRDAEGEAAEFVLEDFDPDVNSWTACAIDDSKFRAQGLLESPALKRDSSKHKAFLDRSTKTTMHIKLNFDGKEPIFTWHAPGAKVAVGTKRGRDLAVTWEKEGAHSVEIWIKNAKAEPGSFYLEAPAKK